MEITEEGRHKMYLRFDEVLGREVATMLMEHLPPVGWADVATKGDLDHLKTAMDLRFDALRHELRGEIHQATTKLVFAFIGANAAIGGLVLAASRVI
jgi:hypothetical protein